MPGRAAQGKRPARDGGGPAAAAEAADAARCPGLATAAPWLGTPVIATDAATCWHALRPNGIMARPAGVGRLMEDT